MKKLKIGDVVLCKYSDGTVSPAEIVEIITKETDMHVVVRIPDLKQGEIYETINHNDIIQLNNEKHSVKKSFADYPSWEQKHIEDINAVFQKDMSKYTMAVYDDFSKIVDDFGEDYATDTRYCRRVLDKWVFIMA